MPKLTDARKELRREQIVGAARRCFVRTGLERTSVADITAESGLSAGSIYAHFGGKAEIIQAVVQEVLDRRAATVIAYAAGPRPPSPAEVIAHLAGALETDEATVALQAWGEATTDPAIRDIVTATIARMRDLFRVSCEAWLIQVKGVAPAEAGPRATRLAGHLLGAYQALLLRRAFGDRPEDHDAIVELVDALS
ncbi:TetR/AcrR family transcriptional regulator [Asanoa sp. WMMD1127]|uniref:TetR/AcrR family transcriptional regulator n=1 Tax=Asanoa sp. WMMD1127 TaxID=3016107 RepID=UPI002417B5CA|nr:TetR/AcrR family transcriptional regulator [Asanoa sp. WMMD1127]MDG4826856.1 TetR/AcrR family transcriptional regulator [Asanoa sp. WMMD1127]